MRPLVERGEVQFTRDGKVWYGCRWCGQVELMKDRDHTKAVHLCRQPEGHIEVLLRKEEGK